MNEKQKKIDSLYKKCKDIKEVNKIKEEITRAFHSPRNFQQLSKVGRLEIESFTFKDNDIFYAIPLKGVEELTVINKSVGETPWGLQILSQANVPLIPYKSKVYSKNIIKNSNYLEEYEDAYTVEYMLSQIYTVYSEINEFTEFQHIILEAIECFLLEKYAAAISLMVSLIEGISSKYCSKNNIEFGNNRGQLSAFKALLKYKMDYYIENIMLLDYSSGIKYELPTAFKYDDDNKLNKLLLYYDEGLNLLYSFFKYGTDYLYERDSKYELNRHSIFHGINKEYCTRINFYRIFSCLECLSFTITLEALGNFYGVKPELKSEYNNTLHKMILLKKFNELQKNIWLFLQ